jgi:hypothetical protein
MKQMELRDIEQAQQIWADRLTDIGKAFLEKTDHQAVAKRMIDELYGYQEGMVLFKPTKVREKQFRLNSASALSYFIGNNPDYPEDKGFALRPWKNVRFENAGVILKRKSAIVMGNYYFSDYNEKELMVEFTIGYFFSAKGNLKINLHHSSFPFSGEWGPR